MAFTGTYTPRLDEKGRIILPAKYREAFAERMAVTIGPDGCLHVYPGDEFDRQYAAQKAAHPPTDKEARFYLRKMSAEACTDGMDKQGRVTIPQRLRVYAQIDRECTVIGCYDYLEIWSTEVWQGLQPELDQMFRDAQ